jgi:hypothetical protein
VDIVLRLLPYLDRVGISFKVLALTTAGPHMLKAGYSEFRSCRYYLPRPDYEQAMAVGAELSSGLWDATSGIPWEESCAYLGISMIDLIAELGETEARCRYQVEGRKIFCPVRFVTGVLLAEQPRMVVTTCHVRMERATVLAARDLEIPSVRIDDLFGYSLLKKYNCGSTEELLPESEWPDHVVVLNEEIRQRLTTAGFPSARIHPLGQPVFSEWLEQFEHVAPSSSLADWCAQGRPIISYVTPARRDVLGQQMQSIIKAARLHPEWGICIKLHPSIGRGEFDALFAQKPDNLRLIVDEDILPVVRASDLVLIFRSTVGILCLATGVPLLVLDSTGEPEAMPYVSSGAVRSLSNLDKLSETIETVLAHGASDSEKEVLPLFMSPAGATGRIANWLASCMS